jgi:hypothetical protein
LEQLKIMTPARRGIESLYDSDTFVSTCTTPEFAPAQSGSAPPRKAGGESIEGDPGAAGAFAVVPERLGRDRREDTQRARNALCMPVLPAFASGLGSGARFSQIASRKMGEIAPGGGIEETCLVH